VSPEDAEQSEVADAKDPQGESLRTRPGALAHVQMRRRCHNPSRSRTHRTLPSPRLSRSARFSFWRRNSPICGTNFMWNAWKRPQRKNR
jgi:hypothetical protein